MVCDTNPPASIDAYDHEENRPRNNARIAEADPNCIIAKINRQISKQHTKPYADHRESNTGFSRIGIPSLLIPYYIWTVGLNESAGI
jgi:hypothetical protein